MKTADVGCGLRPPEGRARAARRGNRRAGRRLVPPRRLPARAAARVLARDALAVGDGRPVVAPRRHRPPVRGRLSQADIRLTTRFDPDNLSGILSCLHEFGHGIYERQVDARYSRTPLQRRRFVVLPRVAEPALGERRRAPSLDVALLLSAIPGDVPRAVRGRAARGLPPRAQPRRAERDPRGRRRGHVFAPHRPALRARAGDARGSGRPRPTCRRRSTRSSASTWASSRPTSSTACSRTSTGRTRTSATSRRTRSGTSSPCSSGSGRRTSSATSTREFERGEFGLSARVAARARPPLGPCVRAAGAARARRRRAARRGAVPRVPPREGRGARVGVVRPRAALDSPRELAVHRLARGRCRPRRGRRVAAAG